MKNIYGILPTKFGVLFICNEKNKRGWNQIPKKYKTRENYETYCYLNHLGFDALSMFLEEINKLK